MGMTMKIEVVIQTMVIILACGDDADTGVDDCARTIRQMRMVVIRMMTARMGMVMVMMMMMMAVVPLRTTSMMTMVVMGW